MFSRLQKFVQRGDGVSVPRNAVYNDYTFCCGDHRTISLNPASFGKLVRIIFPQTQTRRLGVRGNSKYHYVNLTLVNESNQDTTITQRAASTPKDMSNPVELSKSFARYFTISFNQHYVSIVYQLLTFMAELKLPFLQTMRCSLQQNRLDISHSATHVTQTVIYYIHLRSLIVEIEYSLSSRLCSSVR